MKVMKKKKKKLVFLFVTMPRVLFLRVGSAYKKHM